MKRCLNAHGERTCGNETLELAGISLVLDPAGALYWPETSALVVADLHLEKGSSFAARGVLLPPYDTAATLARLADLIARYAPRLVMALGDSFHDGGGPARMAAADRAALHALQRGRDWLWIAGNHDPDPAHGIGGRFAAMLALGGLTLRHEPAPEAFVRALAHGASSPPRGRLTASKGTVSPTRPGSSLGRHVTQASRMLLRVGRSPRTPLFELKPDAPATTRRHCD